MMGALRHTDDLRKWIHAVMFLRGFCPFQRTLHGLKQRGRLSGMSLLQKMEADKVRARKDRRVNDRALFS